MNSTIPPTLITTNRIDMLKRLVQGQEWATQLLNILRSPSKERDFPILAPEILAKVKNSFTESLSEINSESSVQDLGTCSDYQRSCGSSESRKRPGHAKDKRGCYKRRKDAQTWVTDTTTLEDGHAWRKYGQKKILNSKFPRAYFRCTHKVEQGCQAAKQVQKLEDRQNLYRTTYIGSHTCKDVNKAPQNITADSNNPWNSCIVFQTESFESKSIIPSEKELDFSSYNTSHEMKQEFSSRDETSSAPTPSDITTDKNDTSIMDSIFWPEDLDTTLTSPNAGSVYSCTGTSSHILELDDFVGSLDFNSDFFSFGR